MPSSGSRAPPQHRLTRHRARQIRRQPPGPQQRHQCRSRHLARSATRQPAFGQDQFLTANHLQDRSRPATAGPAPDDSHRPHAHPSSRTSTCPNSGSSRAPTGRSATAATPRSRPTSAAGRALTTCESSYRIDTVGNLRVRRAPPELRTAMLGTARSAVSLHPRRLEEPRLRSLLNVVIANEIADLLIHC